MPNETVPQTLDERSTTLNPDNLAEAAKFVRGALWADFKRALIARCPAPALVTDPPHVAAAKGFVATSWMTVLDTIERLPFDVQAETPPLISDHILDQRD